MRTTKSGIANVTRRELSRLALASAGTAAAAGLWRPARAQDTYTMRVAHSEAIGSPITNAFDQWVDRLNAESGGRIEAQHFPAGQLGNYTQLIEGSRLGTIQATAGGPDTEEAVAPEIAVTGLGFLFKNEAHVDAVLQGDIGRQMSDIAREKTGVEFVAYGEVGFRHLLAKRPVRNLAELEGLKLRVPELAVWINFWQALGANPTPLAYAEQYNALSTGVIDGLEADFFSILGFNWYEQAQNLTLTYHWFLPKAIRVNAAWLDSLPEDLQALVRTTAQEVFAQQREENRANAAAALEELKGHGVTVYELEDPDAWRAATSYLYDDYAAEHPEAGPMIEAILALS